MLNCLCAVVFVVCSLLASATCSNVESPQGFCDKDDEKCDTDSSMHLLDTILKTAQTYSTSLKEFAKLYCLVQELRKRQQPDAFFNRSFEDRLGHMAELTEYCKDKLHNLEIYIFDEGPGLRVTKDLSKNDVLVTVKLSDTLNTLDSKKRFACLKRAVKPTKDSPYVVYYRKHVFIALRLITEYTKPDSKFRPYINFLPTSFEMPENFSPKELAYMLGSQGIGDVIQTFQEFTIIYIQIYKHLLANPGACDDELLTPDTFLFDHFWWAIMAVLTRHYEDNAQHVLIPCWDMVNHGDSQMESDIFYEKLGNSTTEFGPRTEVKSTASSNIKKGTQLLLEYNDVSSTVDHFFSMWGILEREASLLLPVALNSEDPLYRLKRAILQRMGSQLEDNVRLRQHTDFVISGEDFPSILALAVGKTPETMKQKDWTRMWLYLAKKIRHVLYRYKFPIKKAQRELDKDNLSANARLALKAVITEQEVFRRIRDKCVQLARTPPAEIPDEEEDDDDSDLSYLPATNQA